MTQIHPSHVDALKKAEECFSDVRQRIAEGMKLLHQISTNELWKDGGYSSFNEYVEQGCGISAGFASKLVKVYQHYVIEGGVSQRNLQQVDAEKLYLAVGLVDDIQNKLVKAETWTRQEIRDELASKDGVDCDHNCPHITICSKCHARIS